MVLPLALGCKNGKHILYGLSTGSVSGSGSKERRRRQRGKWRAPNDQMWQPILKGGEKGEARKQAQSMTDTATMEHRGGHLRALEASTSAGTMKSMD